MSKRLQFETPTDIVLKNQIIINDLKKVNHDYELFTGKKRVAVIKTYGCQMNEHDSEKLVGMLTNMGYDIGESYEEADLIIFNTCCVRENAELKVYGNLGSLKKLKQTKKSLKIAVCGCMMQQPHVVKELKKKYRHVDLVFGTHNIHNFPNLLSQVLLGDHVIYEVWENEGDVIEGLPIERKFGLKGYVNIMYGCNNFCTYCIVPYTRGRERSRTVDDIVEEIKMLVAEGAKEVTLLGQNVNSYGNDLEADIDFADLLETINGIEGLLRIRFMTPHPKDISDKLISVMAKCDKVCEHLHLPVQAGSNKVLSDMNRKYTREDYLKIIKKARKTIKDVNISTDLIVGFPGETEEDFNGTLDLVKQAQYESAYTFIYSVRKGTPAADYDNQVADDVKHERFNRLLDVLNGHIIETNKGYQDKIVEVLVEGPSKNDESVLTGRTRQFVTVNFPGDPSLIGTLVNVKITEPRSFSLTGEVV